MTRTYTERMLAGLYVDTLYRKAARDRRGDRFGRMSSHRA